MVNGNEVLVHTGGRTVTADELHGIKTPRHTRTWYPIPHERVYDHVSRNLRNLGYTITKESHALSHDDQRYFSILTLGFDGAPKDYAVVAGIRNSHDKSFPAGLAVGSQVFVCDNLAFRGEIQFARKHTRYISRDLPRLVGDAMSGMNKMRHTLVERIESYKQRELKDAEVHDFCVRAVDLKALPPSQLMDVIDEYRTPQHDDFRPRTGWSLFNAFTEVYKKSPNEMVKRSVRLHELMDGFCDLKPVEGVQLN